MKPEDEDDDSWGAGSLAAWTEAADHQLTTFDRPSLRYVPGGELGRGGMGVVSVVHDIWLGREVALKRPLPGASDDVRRRAMREAAITARLLHPSIVPIFDVGEDEEGPFYTMPVLIGEGFDESIIAGERSVKAHVRVLIKTAYALGYAHQKGFIHRDVKPSNVLVGIHDEVWLLDWGIAYDPHHPTHGAVGTPGFAAPEQVRGEPLTPSADVYSLGCCLSSVLGDAEKEYPELQTIREHAMQLDSRKRYRDGVEFARELERWAEGHRVLMHDYSLVQILWHWGKRRRAPLAVALIALLVGIVGLFGALDVQQTERNRADEAFSSALSQQAMALVRKHGWPEARVLATHALTLADTPTARGALMALGDGPRVELVRTSKPPCEGRGWLSDGSVWCGGTTVAPLDGEPREWSLPPEVGDASTVRITPEGVLFRSEELGFGWWSRVTAQVVPFPEVTELRGASGPTPAWFTRDRVGFATPLGEVQWTEPLCGRISTAWVSDRHLVVGCRGGAARIGTPQDPGPLLQLGIDVSAATHTDRAVFGTFAGEIFTVSDGVSSVAVASGVGVPIQLAAVADGRVVVRGERERARVWAPEPGVFTATLPGRIGPVHVVENGHIASLGSEVRVWNTQAAGAPLIFDRRASGGIAFASLSPSSLHLLVGSGTGEVGVYAADTGAFTLLNESAEASAKAGGFLDEETVVFSAFSVPPRRIRWRANEPLGEAIAFARSVTTWGSGSLIFTGWSPVLRRVRMGGVEKFELAEPIRHGLGPRPWLVDGDRQAYFLAGDDLPEPAFVLPFTPRCLAGDAQQLFATDQATLVAYDGSGKERWQLVRDAPISAMHQQGEWLVVGDVLGRVAVYDTDGELLAEVPAHTRLVSEVIISGDQLFTASWDGTVRRMSLRIIRRSVSELLVASQAVIPLTLEEAIATAND